MAKLNLSNVEQYAKQGGQTGKNNFFTLKNHKESAKVRFLANTLDDFDIYFVHTIDLPNGKSKYVNCLRSSLDEPVDNCPFCKAKIFGTLKIFCPVLQLAHYNDKHELISDTPEVKVWDRGKSYLSRFESLATRYNPLVSTVIEIERNGIAGNTKTDYNFYPLASDGTTLESLPEKLKLDNLVWNKTADEMNYFLINGDFPEQSKSEGNITPRTVQSSQENIYEQPITPTQPVYSPREVF